MAKKIFIVFVILFFTMLLAFAIHKISSTEEISQTQKPAVETEPKNQENPVGTEDPKPTDPTEFVGKIKKVVDGKTTDVKGAVLNSSTEQVLFYQNRNFLLTDFGGKSKSSIGSYPFVKVQSIEWNYDRTKALVKDGDKYFVYNLNKNQTNELSGKIDYAVWFKHMLKDKIAYKAYDAETGKRQLAIADSDGRNEEILIDDLKDKRIGIKIPLNGNRICFHRDPDANFEAGLDCIDLKTKEKSILHKGSFAVDYKWAKNGNRLLVSYVDEQIGNKMVLGSMNGKGGEFRSLNFPTSTEKCVWSKDNRRVFCAMMVFKEKDIILPNDWRSERYSSIDTFWELDVETGKKRRLLDSSEMIVVDSEKLFLDTNESNLFFTDRNTESVYAISLK